jgi:hypothetical protein
MKYNTNSEIRNLIVIPGARKSGTSTLFSIISRSSNVCDPEFKEPQFFVQKKSIIEDNIDWYIKTLNIRSGCYALDASTFYLFSKKAIQNLEKYTKEPKIIIILRDPVTRAYSEFLEMKKKVPPVEERSFENICRKILDNCSKSSSYTWNDISQIEKSLLKKAIDSRLIDKNYLNEEYLSNMTGAPFKSSFANKNIVFNYLSNSFYSCFVDRYYSHFDNVKVLFLEKLISNPKKEISKIEEDMGLDIGNFELPQKNATKIPTDYFGYPLILLKKNTQVLHKSWQFFRSFFGDAAADQIKNLFYKSKPSMSKEGYRLARKILESEYYYWFNKNQSLRGVWGEYKSVRNS